MLEVTLSVDGDKWTLSASTVYGMDAEEVWRNSMNTTGIIRALSYTKNVVVNCTIGGEVVSLSKFIEEVRI